MIDVGHFWGFQADEANLEKQRHLTAEINQHTLHPVSVSLYPNLLCLAPYSEDKELPYLYYRAKILHLRSNTVEVNICYYALWSTHSIRTNVFYSTLLCFISGMMIEQKI